MPEEFTRRTFACMGKRLSNDESKLLLWLIEIDGEKLIGLQRAYTIEKSVRMFHCGARYSMAINAQQEPDRHGVEPVARDAFTGHTRPPHLAMFTCGGHSARDRIAVSSVYQWVKTGKCSLPMRGTPYALAKVRHREVSMLCRPPSIWAAPECALYQSCQPSRGPPATGSWQAHSILQYCNLISQLLYCI
jgi:hypothetical protein